MATKVPVHRRMLCVSVKAEALSHAVQGTVSEENAELDYRAAQDFEHDYQGSFPIFWILLPSQLELLQGA